MAAKGAVTTLGKWLFGSADRVKKAEEQGWKVDDTQFHWTTGDVDEFKDPTKVGKVGKAIYMSPNQQGGKRYLHRGEGKTDVYKVDKEGNEYFPEGSNVMPLLYRGELANYEDTIALARDYFQKGGKGGNAEAFDYAQQELKKQGYSGVRVNGNEIAIFDPKDVRSVNAKFDPDKSTSRNLLASSAGAGILSALAPTEEAEAGWRQLASGVLTPDSVRIAQRMPTAKAAPEDPLTENLLINQLAMQEGGTLGKNLQAFKGDQFNLNLGRSRSEQAQADNLRSQLEQNLLYLYDQTPDAMHGQSKLWYDGANKLANEFAERFDVEPKTAAGVMASLSPQKDWYMNVSLAERLLDAVKNASTKGVTPEMRDKIKDIYGADKYADDVKQVLTKPYNELTGTQKAMFVRTYDEAHNPRGHRIVSPDGQFMDFAKTQKGEEKKTGWGSNAEIAKAISVIENPSIENISSQMGGQHKVRNFYNNIIAPNDPYGDVTIDTHAVAASHLEPFSGKSDPVVKNFGGVGAASSAKTGAKGTYGIYADAYRNAADQIGILPRELQSITWEAVRGLFPAGFKTPKNVENVSNLMSQLRKGKISQEEAQRIVTDAAGGIDLPSWYRPDRDVRDIKSTATSSYKPAVKGAVGTLAALGGGSALASPDAPTKANAASPYNPYRAAKIEAEQLRAKQRDPLNVSLDNIDRNPAAAKDILGALGAGIEKSIPDMFYNLQMMAKPEIGLPMLLAEPMSDTISQNREKFIQQNAPDYKPTEGLKEEEATLWQLLGGILAPF